MRPGIKKITNVGSLWVCGGCSWCGIKRGAVSSFLQTALLTRRESFVSGGDLVGGTIFLFLCRILFDVHNITVQKIFPIFGTGLPIFLELGPHFKYWVPI